MRYFANITTAEELKNKFRTLCQTMHPDKGGNAEEFKNMLNEYEAAQKMAGGWTKQERASVDEWAEIMSQCKNTTKGAAFRVGDFVTYWDTLEYCHNLRDAFDSYLRYIMPDFSNKRQAKASRMRVGKIQSVVSMTDEEVNAFDWFNSKPAGAGEGGSFGPIYDAEPRKMWESQEDHAHYYYYLTMICTPSRYFFIDCEGYEYARAFGFPEYFEEFDEYKAAAEALNAEREAERIKEEKERAERLAAYVARCNKWAHLMQEIPVVTANYSDPEHKAQERKAHSARRSNVLAMVREAFPGVKFSLSFSRQWGGGFTISWVDGPTADELREACDLDLFVSRWDTFDGMTDCSSVEHAEFTDFANKFGGFYGTVSLDHTNSQEKREAVRAAILKDYTYFEGDERTERAICDDDLQNIAKAVGATNWQTVSMGSSCAAYDLESWARIIADKCSFEAVKAEKVPEFVPKHNTTYKTIKKTMGAHAVGSKKERTARGWRYDNEEIKDIYALIDFVPGCGLFFGCVSEYAERKHWYSFYSSTITNDRKRIAKYQAVGIEINAAGEILSISPEIIEGLKADRESVEQQRKAWEESQSEPKAEKKAKKATQSAQPEKVGEVIAEADGVQLVATEKGAAFTGNTYAHKADIKAIGARWYRLGGCWTINADKMAEAAELVNSWAEDETVAEPEQVTEEATDPTAEAENIAGRVYVVTLKCDESWNISQSVGGYFNSLEDAQKHLQALKSSAVIPGYRKVFVEYLDGCGLPCSFSMVEEPGALPNDSARVWVKFVLWEDVEGVGPDGVPFMGFSRGEFVEDIKQERTKEEAAKASTMDAATCEAVAAVLASVADIVAAVKEYHEQAAGLRPDIANVLLSVMDKISDKAQTLATVCAVLAGFYPESRDVFDALGLRAWASGADELPAIWSELLNTSRGVDHPLADWLHIHGAAA